MYSLAQLEARPSLTKEANKISCDQQLLKEDNQEQQQQCQKKNNNKCADQQLQKVQKPTKSVRIVEPPKAVVLANNKPRDNPIRRGCAPPAVSIPLNPLSSFISSAVNRPRSVTDALFAAAPEVVAQTQGPTPSAAAAVVVAVAKDGRAGQQNPNQLPEDMNKGFLQFAEVDPELTSKYILTGKELWTRREQDKEVLCTLPDGI